ncbi:MAG: hypothetical protein GY829_05850 [Gammaproteobacteria bacterium]|nr:hypothetical protein [Gammaproteobacteria bacterium]
MNTLESIKSNFARYIATLDKMQVSCDKIPELKSSIGNLSLQIELADQSSACFVLRFMWGVSYNDNSVVMMDTDENDFVNLTDHDFYYSLSESIRTLETAKILLKLITELNEKINNEVKARNDERILFFKALSH